MKKPQNRWKWIALLIIVLCLVPLLIIAGAVLWLTPVERTTRVDEGAEATIAVLAAEVTRQAMPATTALPSLIVPGVTPTDTPLPSPTASDTPLPTPTPTDTAQPTDTARPTSRPTSTPEEPPMFLSLTARPDPIERGGMVTLSWRAPRATSVGITRLSPEGDIFLETEALDLPASGSIGLRIPEEYTEAVKYYFGARDAEGGLHKAYVTVGILCRYDEYMAPRCPLTQDAVWAAYEPFERGHMVWRSDTREIIVLYADGRKYEVYDDTWQEGDPVDVPGTPPPGLQAPVRGFGHLYAHQPGVREGLGWATAPEAGYTMEVETIHGGSGRYPGTSVYFTLPDGRVVNLYPFTSTWEILP
ncbi:MAG: hypothetical protein P8189_20060 [Anaerolineae bacterium]